MNIKACKNDTLVNRVINHSAMRHAPWAVLLFSLAMALFFWYLYDISLRKRGLNVYTGKTEEIAERIIARMRDNEQVLRGAAGLRHSKP